MSQTGFKDKVKENFELWDLDLAQTSHLSLKFFSKTDLKEEGEEIGPQKFLKKKSWKLPARRRHRGGSLATAPETSSSPVLFFFPEPLREREDFSFFRERKRSWKWNKTGSFPFINKFESVRFTRTRLVPLAFSFSLSTLRFLSGFDHAAVIYFLF